MSKILLFAPVLLILVPLLVDRKLSERNEHYTQIAGKYERYCVDDPCEVDFNGDGKRGLLIIDRKKAPASGYDSWLVIIEDGRELLRLPHWYIDGSFRTHIAIRNDPGGDRLLLFDGTHAPPDSSNPPSRLVFAWNGQQVVNVPPTDFDREILLALATRDDSGTFNYWTLYEFIRLPILTCYYLLLAAVITWLVIRYNRNARKIIKNLP